MEDSSKIIAYYILKNKYEEYMKKIYKKEDIKEIYDYIYPIEWNNNFSLDERINYLQDKIKKEKNK